MYLIRTERGMEKRSYDYLEFFTIEELLAKKTSFYQNSELNR